MAAVVALTGMVALPAPALAGPADVRATEVTFTGAGGVVLHGTVLTPAMPAGPSRRPGLVMLEGAGNRGRGYLMPEAQAYARHGIVTLVYDKRTVGYSMLKRDYGLLAEDALAGLRLLRSRADVDPARAGLWALSEGAFAAPIAAGRSSDVAFLITVGAVGVTPAAQTAWAYGTYLQHAGVSGSLPHTMRGAAIRTAVGAGVFAEATFDPVPYWEHVRQPVLAQWGRLDRDAVPAESSRRIRAALERGGNTRHTIRVVDATNHNLHRTANDGFDRRPDLPPDYGDAEARWIADPRDAPAPSRDLDPEPAAPIIPNPAWYEHGAAQLTVFVTMLVAFMVYPVAGAVRRIRRRPARPGAVLGPLARSTRTGQPHRNAVVSARAPRHGRESHRTRVSGSPDSVAGPATPCLCHRRRHPRGRLDPGQWPAPSLPGRPGSAGPATAAGLVFTPWSIHWGLLIP